MALILKDRVKESSSSSGTGNITLGGAFPGYQTFNAAIASGSTVYYTIHNLAAGFDTEWEVGVGTFTAPATLARNTVLSSSTGSTINFTAGTNGLEVFITQPAEQALYTNQSTGLVESSGNGANTIAFTNINASNVVMVSGTISTNASNATDITNKQYVDGLVLSGTHFHEPVLVEEDVALVAVYNQPNGAGNGVGATLTNNAANAALVVDGVSVSNTARILVYAQSNAVQNGVYTVTNPGNASAQWVLTRSTDTDTFGLASSTQLSEGSTFFVTAGNTGAGRTYTCNTQGTITFGSTNITFAEIGSAQIYSAGTGLTLANLAFSISNTAVTANTYGNDGAVGQFTVNAQGQITNAATVSVNASAISLGTLANARTTAASANGASTIVARDTNGSFAANVGTFTTVNGNGASLTGVVPLAGGVSMTGGLYTRGQFGMKGNVAGNPIMYDVADQAGATVLEIGRADNVAATTAMDFHTGATSVDYDTRLEFTGGNGSSGNGVMTIRASAVNLSSPGVYSGNGSGLTNLTSINASNISSGTIANARTTAASANGASTIVLRDAGGNFVANTITANISGDISGGTNINASNITSGTISNARTTAASANGASTIVLRDVNGSFDANVVNATNLSGGGTSITSINASNLSAGTVPVARVSGSYTGITGVGTVTAGTWQGNAISTTYTDAKVTSATAVASTGINISSITTTGAATHTITNTGVTSAVAGTGISVSGSTGAVTFTNTGVTSAVAGTGVSVSGGTGAVTFSIGQAVGTGSSVQFGSLGVGTAASGTTGEIRATNNVTAFYSSDERLKDNVQVIANALAKVLQIRGVEFDWNNLTEPEDGYFVRKHDVGVIAQEIEKVLPEVVGTREDGIKAVKYDRIIPLLIEAIKELKAEVDALKGK